MQRRWVVSPDYRAAIEVIKAVRVDRGVTQRELARRLCKPPSFVNKVEFLERRLDILEFVALARALEITPEEMMSLVTAALPGEIEL